MSTTYISSAKRSYERGNIQSAVQHLRSSSHKRKLLVERAVVIRLAAVAECDGIFHAAAFFHAGPSELRVGHSEAPKTGDVQSSGVPHQVRVHYQRTERNDRLQRVDADDSWNYREYRAAAYLYDENRDRFRARSEFGRNRRKSRASSRRASHQ